MPSVATPNYGLISGIAQGMNQGLITYSNMQNMKHQQQMQELMTGVTPDQNGNLQLAPWKQQQMQLQEQQAQRQSSLMDPDSPESQQERQMARGILHDSSGNVITDNMSGYDIENNGLIKPYLQGQIMANMYGPRNNYYDTMSGVKTDQMAGDVGSKFDKDPQLLKLTGQRQQINIDLHTLATAQKMTPQIQDEITTGIGNAISGAKGVAVNTADKQEYNNLATRWAKLQQDLGNGTVDISDPEVKSTMSDTLQRLGDAYDRNAYSRAQQIGQGLSGAYSHNPQAVNVLNAKIKSYDPEHSVLNNTIGMTMPGQGLIQGQDPQVANYAKQYNLDYGHALQILTTRGYKPNAK
jgi:hypothetical protein